MAEYLSPGVYVEEFESGSKPMEGVSTSTAGFIGLAEKGPVIGIPELVTNIADFRRIYGGYLSENEYGEYRYLSYAVEHFFLNGGSRAFISRVAPADATCAKAIVPSSETPELSIEAKNPGKWGDNIRVTFTPASKSKTQIFEVLETVEGTKYVVKNAGGFNAGDIVSFVDGETVVHNKVIKSRDNIITFETPFEEDVVDKGLIPLKFIQTEEFSMEVRYENINEVYDNVSFNIEASNYIGNKTAKSDVITANYIGTPVEITPPFKAIAGEESVFSMTLRSGSDGDISGITAAEFIGTDSGAGQRTGIQSFLDNDLVSIMAMPGIVEPNAQLMLVAHCENLGSRFAVLDVPKDEKKVADVINHRNLFDSNYAALYHPWLTIFDPLSKKNIPIPPSGSVIGIYARSDNTRGVHKAPANEVVRGCVGLECQFNKGEQDILNPKGVNLIRSFAGQGIRVWGARTVTSNASWKYINVRRLFIFIEETIKANTNWAVFEPNDEVLWVRVQRTISVFLTNLWRNGSLAGTSPEEAFFVNIGRDTMSQDDIDNGRLICVIGVSPVKPAEFVIFRISQKTADSE